MATSSGLPYKYADNPVPPPPHVPLEANINEIQQRLQSIESRISNISERLFGATSIGGPSPNGKERMPLADSLNNFVFAVQRIDAELSAILERIG